MASGADFGYTLGLATAELTDFLRIAGDLNAAEARAKETLAIGERIQVAVLVGLANEQLARLALARDEPGQAEELMHRALAAHLDHGAVRYLPQTFDALAEIAGRLDSGEEAARILGAAHRLREELGLVRSRHDEPRIAALEQTLREQLGDAGLADAFEQGMALSTAEAVTWMRHARGDRYERGSRSLPSRHHRSGARPYSFASRPRRTLARPARPQNMPATSRPKWIDGTPNEFCFERASRLEF